VAGTVTCTWEGGLVVVVDADMLFQKQQHKSEFDKPAAHLRYNKCVLMSSVNR
jgi:hypothetical protein